MSSHHDHNHSIQNLKAVFFLNLFFTVIEIVGGLLTNSVAILSDAVHDFGDSLALATAWVLERLSGKRRTDSQTFGYRRFSVLGALISSIVLIVGSVFILSEAIPRLFSPEAVNPEGMMAISILGIVVNGLAVLRLRGARKLNERVVFLHLLEDVLGWAGVLIVSVVLLFWNIPILDPILSIAITAFVLYKIVPNIRSVIKVLLQFSPGGMDLKRIESTLKGIDSLIEVHDMHLWSLDGHYNVFTAHVVVDDNLNLVQLEEMKRSIRERLVRMGIDHSTVEFEPSSRVCPDCDL
jgi:cobalt-zinc-cadmium efflux system protein